MALKRKLQIILDSVAPEIHNLWLRPIDDLRWELTYFNGVEWRPLDITYFNSADREKLDYIFDFIDELDAAHFGLGNVDNTSDLNKPVSIATQTALNHKLNTPSPGKKETGVDAGVFGELSIDGEFLYFCTQSGDSSTAVWAQLQSAEDIATALSEAISNHQHSVEDITDIGDIATINKSGGTTQFLRGDGTWQSPPVTTVNGYTGKVVITPTDLGLEEVENKNVETILSELTFSNVTTALGFTPLNSVLKGAVNGLAELNESGVIPASQLPSFVDDVIEYDSLDLFPAEGTTGKIYVAKNTNLTYRWSGTGYINLDTSLALGVTSETAYRGDYGNTAYLHSRVVDGTNPHQITFSNLVNKPTTISGYGITDATPSSHIGSTGNAHGVATSEVNGFMSADDKVKLTNIDDELALKADQTELDQLAGEVSLLDAVQGAKIKDIENVLSTANLNQSAQLSVSGRKTISLPKNSANSGMSVKLEGLTAENLVTNGDFMDGTTGWIGITGSSSVVNGELYNNGNNENLWQVFQTVIKNNQKYYIKCYYRIIAGSFGLSAGGMPVIRNDVTAGSGYFSKIYQTTTTNGNIIINIDTSSQVYIDNVQVINLTQTFGSGNEPDLATCDAMFSDYFEGVKSFEPTGRVRSVGKNLLNPLYVKANLKVLAVNGSYSVSTTSYSTLLIKVKPNTGYRIDGISSTATSLSAYYDVDGNYISRTGASKVSGRNLLTPANCYFVNLTCYDFATESEMLSDYYAHYDRMVMYESLNSPPHEPYKETNLYLTAPELRSNGTVKDEIRKGSNGYELVKRVGIATLSAEKVINGDLSLSTGWTISGTGWSISDGKARCNSIATSYIRQNGNMTTGAWQKVKATAAHTRGISSYITGNAGTTTNLSEGVNSFFVKHTGITPDAVFLGQNYEGTLDDVSIKELIPQDGAISGTSTFTELSDGTILYTLATPIITPISYGGILNSAEDGTVYHEPIIADAGVYGTSLSILMTDYPIDSIEEIIKHENGVDTYLNVASAVVAGDGLSFTHPDLTDGDLVLFTYAFDKESTNGNITATFYDSNVVKIDTETGKAYKIEDVITNGELTRTLTEV